MGDGDLRTSIEASAEATRSLLAQTTTLEAIREATVAALRGGNKVLTAGLGGSAADALHMAEELVGRFDADRVSLPAVSLVADSTALTCISNDYGFDEVFARQVRGLGTAGDVLFLFSTSGRAACLERAVSAAEERRVTTVALLGKGGGPLKGRCDHELIVEQSSTARIQEAHTVILHLVLEAVDRWAVGRGR